MVCGEPTCTPNGFKTIRYMEKATINLTHSEEDISAEAREVIDKAKDGDVLVLGVIVNNPAHIEHALPLTKENIKTIVEKIDSV